MFSIFGKKKPVDGTEDAAPETPAASEPASPADTTDSRTDPASLSETTSLPTSHRDLARLTAEKIDAIEQEITRDILRAAPPESVEEPAATAPAAATIPDPSDIDETDPGEPTDAHLFHTTLVRLDNETMIMPKDAMDN